MAERCPESSDRWAGQRTYALLYPHSQRPGHAFLRRPRPLANARTGAERAGAGGAAHQRANEQHGIAHPHHFGAPRRSGESARLRTDTAPAAKGGGDEGPLRFQQRRTRQVLPLGRRLPAAGLSRREGAGLPRRQGQRQERRTRRPGQRHAQEGYRTHRDRQIAHAMTTVNSTKGVVTDGISAVAFALRSWPMLHCEWRTSLPRSARFRRCSSLPAILHQAVPRPCAFRRRE